MSRLKDFYEAQIVPEMTKKFSYTNKLAVPKLEKIIINMGVGEARENAKVLDGAVKDMSNYLRSEACSNKGKKIHRELSSFVKVCTSAARLL